MTSPRVFPSEFGAEIAFDKPDTPAAVRTVQKQLTAATANQDVVALVTGKLIRVLSVVACSDGAASTVYLHSSTTGSDGAFIDVPANTVATPNVILPENKYGWFNSAAVGEKLQADCGAVVVRLAVTYYIYTPAS